MGLGKTVSTLTALSDLRESLDVYKTLVVAPKRVARKTWSDEILEWAHLNHLTVSIAVGTEKQRLAALDAEADIHLINRENCEWLFNQFVKGTGKKQKLIRPWPWDTVVLDESQSFKSQSSKRWKAMRRLRKFYDRCIQLTGTPAPNGYLDLWAQFALLDRGQRLGLTERAFKNRWMNAPSRYDPSNKWEMKGDWARQQIQELVADITISMDAEDYLDLPPVMYNPVVVTLTRKQQETYEEMAREFYLDLEGKEITAVNAGVLAGKLLQLANGAIYYDEKKYKDFHNHKLDALEELLDGMTSPVILGYNYRHDLERILTRIKPWAKREGKKVVVMQTVQDEEAWNRGEIDVLIMHPASGGHGLNLHKCACETIILFGLNWSLELYQQLNARLAGGHRRIGKNVIIHHIIAENTIDVEVMARLEHKDCTQNEITGAVKTYVKEKLK
jgi:SNF2 family DNA or RNA helicase